MLLDFVSNNYSDVSRTTRAHFILGLMFPLLIVTVLLVFMRVLVKAKLGKLGLEDVFIVFASVSYISIAMCRVKIYPDNYWWFRALQLRCWF